MYFVILILLELAEDAGVNSTVMLVGEVVQYLGDHSRLVVLSTVDPSVFTVLLLQGGGEGLWT